MALSSMSVGHNIHYIYNLGGAHGERTYPDEREFAEAIRKIVPVTSNIIAYTNNEQTRVRTMLKEMGFTDTPFKGYERMHSHYISARDFAKLFTEEVLEELKKKAEEKAAELAKRRENYRKPGEFRIGDRIHNYRPNGHPNRWRGKGVVTDVLPNGDITVNGDCTFKPIVNIGGWKTNEYTVQRNPPRSYYW